MANDGIINTDKSTSGDRGRERERERKREREREERERERQRKGFEVTRFYTIFVVLICIYGNIIKLHLKLYILTIPSHRFRDGFALP